jgi:hypothetical protein
VSLSPHQILLRLEQIEQDAAARQAKGEQAAERFFRVQRDYELEFAKAFVEASGSPNERKQKAHRAMEGSQLYYDLKEAEGAYEGWRACMRTLELRASIGQSLLRAQRERGA